jgi:hypothetical protein
VIVTSQALVQLTHTDAAPYQHLTDCQPLQTVVTVYPDISPVSVWQGGEEQKLSGAVTEHNCPPVWNKIVGWRTNWLVLLREG